MGTQLKIKTAFKIYGFNVYTRYEVLYRELVNTCIENFENCSNRKLWKRIYCSAFQFKSTNILIICIRHWYCDFSNSLLKTSLLAKCEHHAQYAHVPSQTPIVHASALDSDPPASHNLSQNIDQITSLSLFYPAFFANDYPGAQFYNHH